MGSIMSINFSIPKAAELKPRIVVIGVGGAGGNAVNNMISSGLDGVDFVVANTDAQALALSKSDRRVQMGGGITEGLGAGMRPEVGEQSAEDSLEEILEHLDGAHMLFVAAGMGGGTGTGAAPVIARAARERGILTVAIITKPRRAIEAAESAVSNPLLDDVSLKGARGVLINITGGQDLTLFEVDEAASLIRGQVDEDANIIVGSALDPDLDGIVRVSVVATGVGSEGMVAPAPLSRFRPQVEVEPEPIMAEEEEEQLIESIVDTATFAHRAQHAATAEMQTTPPPMPEPLTTKAADIEPAYEAPRPYPRQIQPEPVAIAPAPVVQQPIAEPAPQRQSGLKSPFGFFGRKKTPAPIPAPQPQPQARASGRTGELFGDNSDEELEIPAFLRRQNR